MALNTAFRTNFADRVKSFLSGEKSRKVILAAGGAAMLMLLISTFSCGGTEEVNTRQETSFNAEQAEKNLEERVTRLVSQISGTGDPSEIEVMVTLDTTSTAIYEKDNRFQSAVQNNESGGSENRSAETEVVLAGSGKEPLTVGTVQPKVRGVSVVCSGAQDPLVCERVTNAVAKALDIGVSRVCVTY